MVELSDTGHMALTPPSVHSAAPADYYNPFPTRPVPASPGHVMPTSYQSPPMQVPQMQPTLQHQKSMPLNSRHQQASVQSQINQQQYQPRLSAQQLRHPQSSSSLAPAASISAIPSRASTGTIPSRSPTAPSSATSGSERTKERERTPSGSINGRPSVTPQVPSLPVSSYSFSHPHAHSHSTIVMASRGMPLVYPALLSAVAEAFVETMQSGDRVKDGLTYKNAFTGADAVDVLMHILQTPDRTLALLLGRALDSMKLFHDVTYVHKLRDNQDEVYQLRDGLDIENRATPVVSPELEYEDDDYYDENEEEFDPTSSTTSRPTSSMATTPLVAAEDTSKQAAKTLVAGINGIFMLMTECYSPTCTRSQVCYAVHCPKRLEQQFRVKELHPTPSTVSTAVASNTDSGKGSSPAGILRRQNSTWSINTEENEKENKLWIHSVSKEIVDSVDERERMRQEVICEVIYTERDFVKDLEYIRDFWIIPLRKSNIIPEHRREKFIRTVFSNVMEVHAVNSRLAEALTKRQQQSPVVQRIGDILLEYIPRFVPFIRYGANQLYGKHEFEREKTTNPNFSKFVDETERMTESRKLELNGYLTKPTTRLAKYPLLLEQVLKYSPIDSVDRKDLLEAVVLIREFLTKVNVETGKANNRYELMQLSRSLIFPPGEYVDLKLTEEGRQILFQGTLKKRLQDQQGDVAVYLLDHCLLFVRKKVVNRREQFKVFRKPIPLELLIVSQSEDGTGKRPSSSLIPTTRSAPSRSEGQNGKYPITFYHLGRRGYELILYAQTFASRKKWLESIIAQQHVLRERSGVYVQTLLCTGAFDASNRVTCAAPFDGGRKMLYGTDSGIYVSDTRPARGASSIQKPQRLLAVSSITQIEVLEEYSMLLALSDKTLLYWSLDSLEMDGGNGSSIGGGASGTTAAAVARRPKKVATHINFFKSGVSLGRVLVCTVKTNAMTTTVRALEPEEPHTRGKKQTAFRRLLQSQSEGLKVFKDFYVPSEAISISFLKSKVCIGCAKGFEIVSLETLDTQSLLDPADTSLDFVMHKEGLKPIAIYRLNGDFLLNYSDFSFFVNRNGWRSRPDWMIHWEGLPQSFALSYPYILAFEPSFIEIRHVESGALVHIITGENIRFLHESTNEILYVYEDERGFDAVAWLDFWGSAVARPSDSPMDSEHGTANGNGTGRPRLDD